MEKDASALAAWQAAAATFEQFYPAVLALVRAARGVVPEFAGSHGAPDLQAKFYRLPGGRELALAYRPDAAGRWDFWATPALPKTQLSTAHAVRCADAQAAADVICQSLPAPGERAVTREGIAVRTGQLWVALDIRRHRRTRRVIAVEDAKAVFEGPPTTKVAVARMYRHSTGFELAAEIGSIALNGNV